ncbi:hypothetical protein MLD52_20110 [Puniceicoccaceae bacterium K14]|nr:hypothetical protein [Puniceicoccaceae bacterium K14]
MKDALESNRSKFGNESRSLFVGGHSSGGHLATLLATNPQYLAAEGLRLSDLAGAIPVEGAYDIEQYRSKLIALGTSRKFADLHVQTVFGDDSKMWKEASPASFLEENNVPLFVVTGDEHAFNEYAKPLTDAPPEANNITFYHAKGRTHQTVAAFMGRNEPDRVREDIIEFIRSVSKETKTQSKTE